MNFFSSKTFFVIASPLKHSRSKSLRPCMHFNGKKKNEAASSRWHQHSHENLKDRTTQNKHQSNIIIFDTQDLSKILRFEVTMVLSFSFKPKKSPLDDTSTAIKIWKTQPHRTNVGDIIIFDTQDATKFLHFVFISKWKPRNLLSMIPAQPQKPERHNNTEQTSAISSFLINRMHHNFLHFQVTMVWISDEFVVWVDTRRHFIIAVNMKFVLRMTLMIGSNIWIAL